jgi:hypothetical protein
MPAFGDAQKVFDSMRQSLQVNKAKRITCSLPTDCVTDCFWLTVPQPTEWQRIGD